MEVMALGSYLKVHPEFRRITSDRRSVGSGIGMRHANIIDLVLSLGSLYTTSTSQRYEGGC
jgi:hypothetical protein